MALMALARDKALSLVVQHLQSIGCMWQDSLPFLGLFCEGLSPLELLPASYLLKLVQLCSLALELVLQLSSWTLQLFQLSWMASFLQVLWVRLLLFLSSYSIRYS